ncbi:hypothetical protein J6590_042131, partial [Homalodisca vitripennis]
KSIEELLLSKTSIVSRVSCAGGRFSRSCTTTAARAAEIGISRKREIAAEHVLMMLLVGVKTTASITAALATQDRLSLAVRLGHGSCAYRPRYELAHYVPCTLQRQLWRHSAKLMSWRTFIIRHLSSDEHLTPQENDNSENYHLSLFQEQLT